MVLGTELANIRKQKGITQEELAALTNITVRTIQRIERGDSVPRTFTLKAIATALEVPYVSLLENKSEDIIKPVPADFTEKNHLESDKYFLNIFCLSCFSFIVIPYVHFLIPGYLLKKRPAPSQLVSTFARRVIRQQIFWVVIFHLLLLATLVYNILMARSGHTSYFIGYLWIVFMMYVINIIVISLQLFKANRLIIKEP